MTNWNEEDHPRVPKGDINGGQFTSKQISSAANSARDAAIEITRDDVDFMIFSSEPSDNLDATIRNTEPEYDKDYYVLDGDNGDILQVRLEGWFPGCMESRGIGKTTKTAIERNYKEVMAIESGWDVIMSGFIPDYRDTEFGVTYIARRIH